MTTATRATKYTVSVRDLGCSIRAEIDNAGKITVTADGGCGPDCLGKSVPRSAGTAEVERILTDRFVRLASANMGERYDASANDLIVEVR